MGYYDDDDEYYGNYYEYDDRVEPVSLTAEDFSEKVLTDVLSSAGLISEPRPKFNGTMEKLVFMYGEDSEVYSPAEIRFIERVDDVLVYPDFTKTLNQGNMVCRTIATRFNCSGHDALRACVSFEKIIDKALDGFNMFLFVTEDGVFFGCRIFDKSGKRNCALSSPISDENTFEQMVDELSFLTGLESFMEYYGHYQHVITDDQIENEDYEHMIMRRRGMQLSYLEDINEIEQGMGVDMSKEKERYWRMFYDEPEETFASLLEEVDESLSFIKSNRVNTYEMLFEADEMMRQAEQAEAENERLAQAAATEFHKRSDAESDEEAQALLDDPEEMIKLLKKRRGL
jgi:hypothetical protein